LDDFDTLLLSTIDETLSYVLGEINANIIYEYLKSNSCGKQEIPQKLDFFSEALRDLLGTGRGQILGVAAILEETIAEAFVLKFGKTFEDSRPLCLCKYIENLKQNFYSKNRHMTS
jgi:hypothetical protein